MKLTKYQKNILKKDYLSKIPHTSLDNLQKFMGILKNQKLFNKKIKEFKNKINMIENINDIYFMSQFTNLTMEKVI